MSGIKISSGDSISGIGMYSDPIFSVEVVIQCFAEYEYSGCRDRWEGKYAPPWSETMGADQGEDTERTTQVQEESRLFRVYKEKP